MLTASSAAHPTPNTTTRSQLKRAATKQALCLNTWKLRLQQRCPARYGGRYL